MASDIVMPRLSDSMEEGTVLQWMKQVGDQVAVGEELVEIETDKANMVYESDAAGTLIEVLASEGETRPIGEVIARVGEPDEAEAEADGRGGGDSGSGRSAVPASPAKPEDARVHAADTPQTATAATPSPGPATATPTEPGPQPSGDGNGRVKASPLARRIATERGVDLAALTGSGPGGRIIKADVERAEPAAPTAEAPAAAAAAPQTARGAVETVELSRLQQTVARRMAESKATAPHFYLSAEIEMTSAVAARARLKQSASEGEPVPSLNDMVIKAAALALREFRRANGAYRDGRWELYERINVGIAVAAADALVVPTIFDADQKGLKQIATEARELARKVREGTVSPPELSGGTFTVSNLGMFGISSFAAVINSGQAAILAVGEVAERPVVRSGELATAQLMGVTLACDHRILYGADGARFLARVRALLEEPVGLAL
ncbi:MAG TPA: dihydrolipoamide acetyltransferase family protein [Solirubrobacterales bacterium]|nr:dihydrolipoamide acetyltransferase family protein [Solirubrobacterales bacterium]